ncbi:MAG: hypothetical protein U9Q81_04305 [Pseudomonadota bacterium]|nr:hypothetical protein [Pseudomonadota bacterium]
MKQPTNAGRPWLSFIWFIPLALCVAGVVLAAPAEGSVRMKKAEWRSSDMLLALSGDRATANGTVIISNAAGGPDLDSTTAKNEGKWRLNIPFGSTSEVPCRVKATDQSSGKTVTREVVGAPGDCDDGSAPPPPSGDPHASITGYVGPATCVECHQIEALDMHGSVHYQQGGAFPNVTNIPPDFVSAGERPAHAAADLVATGVNTYCGTHENSPRFTCAGCHVGNGRFPMAQSEFELLDPNSVEAHEQLANIDCLTCHQELYKRFPDPAGGFETLILENVSALADGTLVEDPGQTVERTGLAGIPVVDPITQDFQFIPADPTNPDLASVPAALMPITADEAAQMVHPTTRKSCLSCHAGAAGADGAKRGDLSSLLADPPATLDMHMSASGANLTCSDCHSDVGPNGEGHRVRGRGLDLRPNDVAERFTCENSGCHDDRPHGDFSNSNGASKDKHAMKVACQSCHIPTYGKGIPTEVSRDWEDPHLSQAACNGRGGWLPREDKDSDLIPTYAWFDGTSEVYYLGEPLAGVPTVPLDEGVAGRFGLTAGDPAYVLGMPNGGVTDEVDPVTLKHETKLYPMKEHWGKLALHTAKNTFIGHSTFEFFRTGSFAEAVKSGMEQTSGMSKTDAFTVEPVHTYQTLNHGVESDDNALECGDCHADSAFAGGPPRMDLQADLGYELKDDASVVCSQCHEFKSSKGFEKNHGKHVNEKGKDCSVCHTFSRPERLLSKSIDK